MSEFEKSVKWGKAVAIAGVIAQKLRMSRRTAEGRIARLVQAGIIEENPHKQEKRHCDHEELVERYGKLVEKGLCDGAIARALSVRPAIE